MPTYEEWINEVNQSLDDCFGLSVEDISPATCQALYNQSIPADDIVFYLSLSDEVIK